MGRVEMRKREDDILTAFCGIVAVLDSQPARIPERPDRDRPGSGGCEAILERNGRRWAVEHTTFDNFPEQRRDNARLRAVLAPATRTIGAAFPSWRITLGVPVGAVPTGVPWPEVAAKFERAVIEAIRALPERQLNAFVELPGLFETSIFRRRPHRYPGCSLVRSVGEDDTTLRVDVIARALEEKRLQLRPYAAMGTPTVLLLDNDDIALMEPYTAADAFRRASERVGAHGLDEIYVVDGTMTPAWFFPVKLGSRVYPLPEFERFFEEQYRRTYGVP